MPAKIIKVLVIDDSALVRNILKEGLNSDPGIEVVATASDPYAARDKILEYRPDVLTLDVEMPRMDGVEFLRKLMPQYPLPVIMVSSLTEKGKRITLDALEAGAVDIVTKPKASVANGLLDMMSQLKTKVKIASTAKVSHWKNKPVKLRSGKTLSYTALPESTDKIIAIGASTGGTEAIKAVISKFPRTTPGVVIVQHMPAGFTRMFSERMNSECSMEVREAVDGDRIMTGRVLIAPGGKHLRVKRSGGIYKVEVKEGPLCCGHCPSVEIMMQSIAKSVGSNAVAAMLTGMGADGATGMKAMRDAGARCIAQDEESCVVFGMPKEAYLKGGAERLVSLQHIASTLLNLLSGA